MRIRFVSVAVTMPPTVGTAIGFMTQKHAGMTWRPDYHAALVVNIEAKQILEGIKDNTSRFGLVTFR